MSYTVKKPKVVQINTFSYKATGTIMMTIHRHLLLNGYESYVVWGRGRKAETEYEISMDDDLGVKYHGLYTRITDKTGFASQRATKRLLEKLRYIQPDVIHLHNIHGYYINIEMLFNYIRINKIKVIWTLHDCWPFTGHCAYFDLIGCEKWKNGCHNCMQLKTYPASNLIDSSEWNWKKKRELFIGHDITLVVPCNWLKNIVSQSFLKDYPIEVIYNGIDTNVFKPRLSDFRKKNKLEDKFIILGVASEWSERKGLKDFIRLHEILRDKENYKIVIVGLNNKMISSLPEGILGLERTNNVHELVDIYSTADVFFNPTYEDNFPTTNLEAIACKTPVITYRTGGSPESINDDCGLVIEQGMIEEVVALIDRNKKSKMGFYFENMKSEFRYSMESMIANYMKLY